MLSKRISSAVLAALLIGCLSAWNPAPVAAGRGGAASPIPSAGRKFQVVVLTPGTAREKAAASRDETRRAETSSGARQLPNYKGETLTLGLLGR